MQIASRPSRNSTFRLSADFCDEQTHSLRNHISPQTDIARHVYRQQQHTLPLLVFVHRTRDSFVDSRIRSSINRTRCRNAADPVPDDAGWDMTTAVASAGMGVDAGLVDGLVTDVPGTRITTGCDTEVAASHFHTES